MTAEPSSREALLALRVGLEQQLAELRRQVADIVAASESSNADDEHDPEGATIAYERAQVLALVDATAARLGEAEAALARITDGTYGVCTHCGRSIGDERLRVRPEAERCVSCARKS